MGIEGPIREYYLVGSEPVDLAAITGEVLLARGATLDDVFFATPAARSCRSGPCPDGYAGSPATPVTETLRGLLLGQPGTQPLGTQPWAALAWCGGLLAGSVLLSMVLFRRRTA